MSLSAFLAQCSSLVWGPPLIILLIGTGMFLSFRTRFIQWRGFRHAVAITRGQFDNKNDPGEISHFRALATALSATVGTGNIVGVSAAILMGGPGAVFWMWVTALVGMATKFTCCTLAVHFRKIDAGGEAHGGPMYYIEQGMGRNFKWLAVIFAVLTMGASVGIGNMFQVNSMVSAVNNLISGHEAAIPCATRWAVGLITAALVAVIILGGIKRIAQVSGFLAPFMCLFYLGAGLLILIKNAHMIVPGLRMIFYYAFHAPESVAGGLVGGVIRSGVARGLFSNEAGLGSAPMAHSAAQTGEPVREGLVAMLGPFIDTVVICSITALVVVCTGVFETVRESGKLTTAAFEAGLPGSGWVVSCAIIFFAFSTLIAWSYYGDRASDYLFGKRAVRPYRMVYVIFVLIGALRPMSDVVNFCDALNGLMALPNLIALLTLSSLVVKRAKEYERRFSFS